MDRIRHFAVVLLFIVPMRGNAQETTITTTIDVWKNACVALTNSQGMLTTDYAYSGIAGHWSGTGTWATIATFADPTPPNSLVLAVKARIVGGKEYGCASTVIAPTLNGISLGPTVQAIWLGGDMQGCSPSTTGTPATGWMTIGYAFDTAVLRDDYGLAGYISGGANTFDLGFVPGNCAPADVAAGLVVEKVELQITYRPVKIYLDIDGNFDVGAPVDDLPIWIPGARADRSSLPPTTTASLQTVNLHVITEPRVRGKITVALAPSHYPGRAMNYPLSSNDTGPDMHFGGGQVTTDKDIVSSNAPADTVFAIQVDDYGASATLDLTFPSGGKKPFKIRKQLPISKSGNRLPDANWTAQGSTVFSSTIATADEDVDSTPSTVTQLGDGFSAYEEYRGFVVGGLHKRLDPAVRDLFLDLDAEIAQGFAIALPFRQHLLGLNEAAGIDATRGQYVIKNTAPVVNMNRSTVPGASPNGQRGVRIVYTSDNYPVRFDPIDQNKYPIWQFQAIANTWQDQMTIGELIGSQAEPFSLHSPNENKFIEVFDRTFSNWVLSADLSWNPPRSYFDDNGQPVPECAAVPVFPCDLYNRTQNVIYPVLVNQARQILYSRERYSDDRYTKFARDCATNVQTVIAPGDFARVHDVVVTHEVGHYLTLDHVGTCGQIMFADSTGGVTDKLPLPTGFEVADQNRMRTRQ